MTSTSDNLETTAAVGDFVEMWTADQRRGLVRPLPDYLARFPGFESTIAREYLSLVEPLSASVAPANEPSDTFGPYRTIRLLGQGGQGTVWLAEDTRLARHVALKVLSAPAATMSMARVERLRREAQTLARLDHPGICAIYEAEFEGPRPYLAMRYVEGETLTALLTRRLTEHAGAPAVPSRTEIAGWLPFFAEVAEALHAAHELNIVHRDVKPGNLMRTLDGAPVVLDFGLARDLESTAVSLTQSGELFGTLAYMAPEVLLGRASDRRVDTYALGITLFEIVTSRRPFVGATHAALRRAIETGEATSVSDLAPAASGDLAVVITTAIERDPDRRYLTAQAFADDLRRVHNGEPIAARPLGPGVRLRRTFARHPVLGTSLGLLFVGFIVAVVLLAQVARGRAQLLALRLAYQAQSLAEHQPGTALYMVSEAALAEPHQEINDILFKVLDRCWEEHAILPDTEKAATESPWIDVSADDRLLVRAMSDGDVRLVDLATAKVARTLQHSGPGQTTAAFCGNNRLLTGGSDGRLRLFDVSTGECMRTWTAHAAAPPERLAIARIAVAPNGRRAASCGGDGLVALIDPEQDRLTLCRGHEGGVDFVLFDPTGTLLVTGGGHTPNATRGDRTVRVFDAQTGTQVQQWGPFAGPMRWVDWSHDGTRLVIARDENCADVCDVAGGHITASLPHGGPVYWAAFANADRQVVTGSPDGLCVFDLATQTRIVRHADFKDRSVFRGAFAPNGTRLAVIAWDDTARIYDTATWQLVRTFRGVATRALGLCWNRDSTRIATVGGGLQTWYAEARPFLPTLRGHRDRVTSAEFAPDGERAVTASADGDARIWDARLGTTLTVLSTGAPLRRARFSPDGSTVLVIGEATAPSLFGPDQTRCELGPTVARDGWYAPDGRIVLTGIDGSLRLHDAGTGALLQTIACHTGPIVCAAFHPQQPWLATGGSDRTYCIVDLENNRVLHASAPWAGGTIGEREQVFGLTFDPTGRWLFAACEDVQVRAIDLANGFACRSLLLGPTPGRLAVARGGSWLLVGAQWGGRLLVVRIADLTMTGIAAAQHSNMITALELQPRGELALSASKDGTVAVFEPRGNRLLSVIHASEGPVLDAHFSHDGTRIVTTAADGEVRIWPTDPLAMALRYRPARPANLVQQR